ncbi:hypothetical protein [Kribbella sancticallisti]
MEQTVETVVLITKGRHPQIMALTDSKLAELYQAQTDAGAT